MQRDMNSSHDTTYHMILADTWHQTYIFVYIQCKILYSTRLHVNDLVKDLKQDVRRITLHLSATFIALYGIRTHPHPLNAEVQKGGPPEPERSAGKRGAP